MTAASGSEGGEGTASAGIEGLVEEIEDARVRFLALFEGLDERAAKAPVGEGRWSPIQYLEHLVLAEEATVWQMFKAVEDARIGGDVPVSPTPQAPIEAIVDRTWEPREAAPGVTVPRWGASNAYWAARMGRNAQLVAAFAGMVEEAELDELAYLHPISGPFTLRQGLEFIRFHLDRHARHIAEANIGSG